MFRHTQSAASDEPCRNVDDSKPEQSLTDGVEGFLLPSKVSVANSLGSANLRSERNHEGDSSDCGESTRKTLQPRARSIRIGHRPTEEGENDCGGCSE